MSAYIRVIRTGLGLDTPERDEQRRLISARSHGYYRLPPADRSPCPALNALANQGYLPRDGRNLTLPMLEAALMEALHMSGVAAHALAREMRPVVRTDGTFDLCDTRMHGVLEHDMSLTRLDFREGDNYGMQPLMLEAMIADADGEALTIETMAKTYIRRRAEHQKSGGQRLGLIMGFKDLLMKVSYFNIESSGHPSAEQVRLFWSEERFEDYILDNSEPRTLTGLLSRGLKLWWHIFVW